MGNVSTVIAASSLLPVHSCSAGRGVATVVWSAQKQPLQLSPEFWGLTSLVALWMKGFGYAALQALEPAKPNPSGFV